MSDALEPEVGDRGAGICSKLRPLTPDPLFPGLLAGRSSARADPRQHPSGAGARGSPADRPRGLTLDNILRGQESAARGPGSRLERLRELLERYHHRQARRAGWRPRFVPTGFAALDAALPHGAVAPCKGLPCGAVVEILADSPGAGAMSLALRVARRCQLGMEIEEEGGAEATAPRAPVGIRPIVLVDTAGDFYPPAAWLRGIELERLVVVRVGHEREAYWAVDQSLRCPGIAAVVASLAEMDEPRSRRLQLAARSSGAMGLLLRPAGIKGKSFAAVRLLVQGATHGAPTACPLRREAVSRVMWGVSPSSEGTTHPDPRQQHSGAGGWGSAGGRWEPEALKRLELRRWSRVTLLAVREGRPAGPLWIDLDDETGAGSLPSESAHRSGTAVPLQGVVRAG